MTQTTNDGHFTKHPDLNWAEIGVLAVIEAHGRITQAALCAASRNGKHSTVHILKRLRALGLIENPRQRDGTNRFIASPYQLTQKAKDALARVA